MPFSVRSLTKRLLEHYRASIGKPPEERKSPKLTPRELEVLQLIAEGYANKQIAGELFVSIKTIEKHRQQLMNKLEIHNVAGLTRYAIVMGVIETSSGIPRDECRLGLQRTGHIRPRRALSGDSPPASIHKLLPQVAKIGLRAN